MVKKAFDSFLCVHLAFLCYHELADIFDKLWITFDSYVGSAANFFKFKSHPVS
jgi:hypothetical protein